MQKYSGARSKDALVEWAKSAEASDKIPKPLPVTEKALSGLVQVLEDLVGVLNKFPVPAIILVVMGILIGMLLGAVICGGSVEYRDRPIYVKPSQKESELKEFEQKESESSTANGPPPLTNPSDETPVETPVDPKTKKDN